MLRRRFAPVAFVSMVVAGAAAAPPAVTPQLTPEQSLQLWQAAGFKPGPKAMVSTICDLPTEARITFLDLNGDGRGEAVAVDKNPACYGAPGDWFTVLRQRPDGTWEVILRSVGIVSWEATKTQGWTDGRVSGGDACDRVARWQGEFYQQSSDCVPGTGGAPAAPGATSAAAPGPAAVDVTAGERAAIFTAAGLTQSGVDWVGCDGQSTASIEKNDVRDLNGDGKPEAIVTERGIACYGNTGQGFYLLTQTAPGAWKLLYRSPGVPEFLATKSKGWPELEVGGPGFCHPILRWDGTTYVFARDHEEAPGGCARR